MHEEVFAFPLSLLLFLLAAYGPLQLVGLFTLGDVNDLLLDVGPPETLVDFVLRDEIADLTI